MVNQQQNDLKNKLKKIWNFIWKDDSAASWFVNVILAFILIKFVVYPLLTLILGTGFPVVAVVSESMEHGLHEGSICGNNFKEFPESFDSYWNICGYWYEDNNITKEEFANYPFKNGFNKGDIIILWRANNKNVDLGDVLVFWGPRPQPIIHRVVKIWEETDSNGVIEHHYQTKGDHNEGSFSGSNGELDITEDRFVGQGLFRIPYLGWIKILAVEFLVNLGIISI